MGSGERGRGTELGFCYLHQVSCMRGCSRIPNNLGRGTWSSLMVPRIVGISSMGSLMERESTSGRMGRCTWESGLMG